MVSYGGTWCAAILIHGDRHMKRHFISAALVASAAALSMPAQAYAQTDLHILGETFENFAWAADVEPVELLQRTPLSPRSAREAYLARQGFLEDFDSRTSAAAWLNDDSQQIDRSVDRRLVRRLRCGGIAHRCPQDLPVFAGQTIERLAVTFVHETPVLIEVRLQNPQVDDGWSDADKPRQIFDDVGLRAYVATMFPDASVMTRGDCSAANRHTGDMPTLPRPIFADEHSLGIQPLVACEGRTCLSLGPRRNGDQTALSATLWTNPYELDQYLRTQTARAYLDAYEAQRPENSGPASVDPNKQPQ